MSSSTRVGATSAASAISVPTRVATGSFTSTERVEGVSGTAPVGLSGYWRQKYGDESGQNNFDGYDYTSGQDSSQPQFTPLVARQASAFPASQSYSDGVSADTLFGSDLLRAVGIYEFNMKLFAGAYVAHGAVINRYS